VQAVVVPAPHVSSSAAHEVSGVVSPSPRQLLISSSDNSNMPITFMADIKTAVSTSLSYQVATLAHQLIQIKS